MWITIAFLVGIFIGIILGLIIFRHNSCGEIKVDQTNEDGPYLFLELKRGVKDIINRTYVVFKVKL